VIGGGGLAAASAIEGIRELDKKSSILLLGREKDLPYDRPPLSKDLWFGKKTVEKIFVQDKKFYSDHDVEVKSCIEVTALDPAKKEIQDSEGTVYHFEKLLLATGGRPRILDIPGGSLDGICYYRNLEDYRKLRTQVAAGKSAVVIGGGFIGSEIAAALSANQCKVTMIFPDEYLVHRIFPESLGRAIQAQYIKRGIRVISGDVPISFEKKDEKFITSTKNGQKIESDLIIVGVGLNPSIGLADGAGLKVGNGIIVDEYLKTSHADIFAAGDNTNFPYRALGIHTRVEHRDNALNQGKQAGRNMAGAKESYNYMPFFYSDLFEFGFEAVGEVDARLETIMDWQKENDTGVIYYTKDNKIRGAMMCNVWDKVEWARDLIRRDQHITSEKLPKIA